ncbi:Membrane-associated phospholipid phosphatase [hydrothermal vent metagenome]|uniref:Membrane-associated phospholipid phosphatase n=1 Tax=hydrothermal vent metagenome TaxID=652676 RepID=A0A1W1CX05_9ZZZZ
MLLSNSLYAKSNTQKLGDILQLAVPIGTYGTTLYLDDKEGAKSVL